MRTSVLIAAAGLALLATPAAAQSWYGGYYGYEYGNSSGYEGGDGYRYRSRSNAVPSNFDWRGQVDRPGDYRCDRFWDANRDDCGDGWRDQRRRVSPQAREDYRELAGYRYGDGYGGGYRYEGYGYQGYGRHRGYGSSYYGGGYDRYGRGGTTYDAAYGRPDVVFPGGGHAAGGRDPRRVDWCRATYRSYDPGSGYYRAYSGRLVWCG